MWKGGGGGLGGGDDTRKLNIPRVIIMKLCRPVYYTVMLFKHFVLFDYA